MNACRSPWLELQQVQVMVGLLEREELILPFAGREQGEERKEVTFDLCPFSVLSFPLGWHWFNLDSLTENKN